MGNDNEAKKIENAHAEECDRIKNIHAENERMLAIKELAVRNGYQLDLRRLENYAEEARMSHQREMRKIEYDAENKRYLAETEKAIKTAPLTSANKRLCQNMTQSADAWQRRQNVYLKISYLLTKQAYHAN